MNDPNAQTATDVDCKGSRTGRLLNVSLLLVVLLFWFVFSLRLISLPLLIVAVWFSRPESKWFSRGLAWMLFVVASLSPLDIRIPELSPSYFGKPQARIGLVRYVVGMPRLNWLITRYGEFYSGGCCGLSAYSPRYILSFAIGSIAAGPRSDRERSIAQEIRKNHGMFKVDEAQPERPVVYVRLWPEGFEAVGPVLDRLKGLDRLQRLELWGGDVMTDDTLAHVKGLMQLQSLLLWSEQVTDAGLASFKELVQIRELDLSCARITDGGLKNLKKLTRLRKLSISGEHISDAGLECLKGLTQLRELGIGVGRKRNRITDVGMEHLRALAQLQTLDLHDTQVTDAGLTHLKGLTQLQELGLSGGQITDAGLECLKGLTQLRDLRLNVRRVGSRITDAGLKRLRGLTKLEKLDIYDTQITDNGFTYLTGLKKLRDLHLSSSELTDAALRHLEGLRELQSVSITSTKITDGGMKKLRRALPNCSVYRIATDVRNGEGER
jgi:Leucine-rich repeat (LRR) protein